jgi:peptide/nickel transport system permease protein
MGGFVCLVPALLGVLAVAFNLLPHNPLEFAGEPNAGPGGGFLLGCDALGRDMASRLGAAAAYFIGPGTLATFVALALGVILGVAESLGGKLWGAVSGWCLEVLDSLPKFVIVLLVASIARSSLVWIMTAVGLTFAPQIAGAIRQSVSRLKDAAFIEAEKSLGVSMTRIVFVHILWGHARYVILAQLMSLMAYAMLVESSLSYLGGELGVQEPTPSWGNMLSLARDGLFSGHVMQAALPAVMISLTILGFTLVGRGMVFLMERRS